MRRDDFTIRTDLCFNLPSSQHDAASIRRVLSEHPEVRFVSLSGVDIAGNDTDEKIPVERFLADLEGYLKNGVQTDGSSVVLPCIATINDAHIDLIPDLSVNWYVDYNYETVGTDGHAPWGTLRIPSFLRHNGRFVCARATLKRALESVDSTLSTLFHAKPEIAQAFGFLPDEVERYDLVAATELEFWVRTPNDIVSPEHLSTSQTLKEQYWKRTKGVVRSALEQALTVLELYGFEPEMGHKEVGGVKAHLHESGSMDHILEQLEIDWTYAYGMQAADNELAVRILVKEIFRLNGLEASFMAKPISGVAGNGEHTHLNYAARLKDGRTINLMAPLDAKRDVLSVVGWGALLGLMRHYDELVAPFITASVDAFQRLRPGFEAPTHTTVSLGRSVDTPSRNRTVLVCVIRNPEAPRATRFELRSPNPHSNTYFVMAAASQAMLDGVRYALSPVAKTPAALEAELNEPSGAYLEADRLYRVEEDLFAFYDDQDRDRLFGRPATTVYDTLRRLMASDAHIILYADDVFSDRLLRAYTKATLDAWELELNDRILMDNLNRLRAMRPMADSGQYDDKRWAEIDAERQTLAKTTDTRRSTFDAIREALATGNLKRAATLHAEMERAMEALEERYDRYKKNSLIRPSDDLT